MMPSIDQTCHNWQLLSQYIHACTMDYKSTGELDRKHARRAIPDVWSVGMPLMQSGLRAAPEVQQC